VTSRSFIDAKLRPVRWRSSNNPAHLGRSVEKQHPRGFRAGTLPCVRHAAWHESTGAGAADRDLVADHEGDLAAEGIGHLVAVVMQMELRSRRCTA